MATTYAGRWEGGSTFFIDTAGLPLANINVDVYLRGTTTHASLYLNEGKTGGAAVNPFTTSVYGNGFFFADPGDLYDIKYNGVTVQVEVFPSKRELEDHQSAANAHPQYLGRDTIILAATPGTDSLAAWNAAFAALTPGTTVYDNPNIYVPAGNYNLSAPPTIPNSVSNFDIIGPGIINWTGGAGGVVFLFQNARNVRWDGPSLYNNTVNKPAIAIEFRRSAGQVGAHAASGVVVSDRTVIGGFGSGAFGLAIAQSDPTGLGNNDLGNFRASILNCDSGVRFGATNGLQNIVTGSISVTRARSDAGQATTIHSASNGQVLPQTTIRVNSAAALTADRGFAFITTSDPAVQKVFYESRSGTTLSGCSGGVGTMSTNAPVTGWLEGTGFAVSNIPFPGNTGTYNVAGTGGSFAAQDMQLVDCDVIFGIAATLGNNGLSVKNLMGEANGRLLESPTALVTGTKIVIDGGYVSCNSDAGDNVYLLDTVGQASALTLSHFAISGPLGVRYHFPSALTRVHFLDVDTTTSEWRYNCSIQRSMLVERAGATTFTNLGSGLILDQLDTYAHDYDGSGTLTITSGGAGTSATFVGNDRGGVLTFTTTTPAPSTGQLALFTFASAYRSAPSIQLTPTNGPAAAINYYSTASATQGALNCDVAVPISTTFIFDVRIRGK